MKAGEKTGELVEVYRLKLACVGLNTNLEKQYQKLGRIVYDMIKTEQNNEEAVFQCVDEIDALIAELRDITEKVDGLKGNICPVCKRANLEDAAFCSFCGASLKMQPGDGCCKDEECCCGQEEANEPETAAAPFGEDASEEAGCPFRDETQQSSDE